MRSVSRVLPVLAWVCLSAGFSPVFTKAEPHSLAGIIDPAGGRGLFSDAFLRDATTGELLAGLLDPAGLLPPAPRSAILHGESTFRVEADGTPLVLVQAVLPEFWAQPASHHHFLKGPSAFSGWGKDFQAKDFAGVPLDSHRAYQHDNGFSTARRLSGESIYTPPPPLRVTTARVSGSDLALGWQAASRLRYRLLAGSSVAGEFTVVQEFTVPADGFFEISLPRSGEQTFYLLQAVQP